MGLRCTVFGHRWGEAGTEREREESGGEVVVTAREVRTCRRCGAEDVLGESTEVTALDPHRGEPATADHAEPTHQPAEDVDEAATDPETDDGVILEEGGESAQDRDPREWPGRPEREGVEERDGEPEPWPESAREQEAEPPEETFVGADQVADDPDRPETAEAVDGSEAEETVAGSEAAGDVAGSEAAGDVAGSEAAVDVDRGATPARDERDTGQDRAEADAGTADTAAARADEERGRDVPEPDEDGIIEAGGPTDEAAVDDEERPGPGADDVADSESGEASGGVDIPRAEADSTADASSEDEEPADLDGATPAETESDSEEPAEPAMGTGADARPDDDAEVLEATEPNEQSRVTAEEPVDPAEALGGDAVDAGESLGHGTPGSSGGGGRSRDLGGATVDDGGDAPSLDPSERPGDEEPSPEDVEYYCPECGFVDDSRWPSRRAGDVCPDCQRSYLAERET